MINFPSITSNNFAGSNRVSVHTTQIQPQTQTAKIVDFSRVAQRDGSAAYKAQVTASDINFNLSFINNIQYLNSQAAVGIHKHVDGKITVSEDSFQPSKSVATKETSGSNSLNSLYNIARDKNGSQSLFYTNSNNSSKQQQSEVHEGRKLKNIFA